MMNSWKYFLLLSITIFISCNQKKEKLIIGKWATYSDRGYSEFTITESTIQVFTQFGNAGEWKYRIENDSIKMQHGYIGHLSFSNDSTFELSDQDTTETFYRLPDTILTYNNSLMSKRTKGGKKLFNEFSYEFDKRAIKFELRMGIISQEDLDKSLIDTSLYKTEEINLNRK